MKKALTMRQIQNRINKIWVDDMAKYIDYYFNSIDTKKKESTRENFKVRLEKKLMEYDLTYNDFAKWAEFDEYNHIGGY